MRSYVGYHEVDPPPFSDSIHTVLSPTLEAQLALRRCAGNLAMEPFSEHKFERGWQESDRKQTL